jgi:ribokinase
VPGANGTLTPARLEPSRDLIASAGLVLLQLEIPIESVVAAARLASRAGALVMLDPAPARELPDELIRLCDYLTPNETELAALTNVSPESLSTSDAAELARKLLTRGAKKVIVKMGGQGALLVSPQTELFWPALPVKAVDTTAAGDAFNAGFASELARGCSEREAGFYASAAAAWSVGLPGAQPSMPIDAEVRQLLKQL